MSWYIDVTGSPEAVARAVDAESAKLSGACRDEYEKVKPALLALVRANFVTDEGKKNGYGIGLYRLKASGSETTSSGHVICGSCQVSLEPTGSKFVGG